MKLLLSLTLIVLTTIFYGYLLSLSYEWFILTTIPNLPHFTLLQFVGFKAFIHILIPMVGNIDIKEEYKIDFTDLCITSIIYPLFLWLFIYIIHLCY